MIWKSFRKWARASDIEKVIGRSLVIKDITEMVVPWQVRISYWNSVRMMRENSKRFSVGFVFYNCTESGSYSKSYGSCWNSAWWIVGDSWTKDDDWNFVSDKTATKGHSPRTLEEWASQSNVVLCAHPALAKMSSHKDDERFLCLWMVFMTKTTLNKRCFYRKR